MGAFLRFLFTPAPPRSLPPPDPPPREPAPLPDERSARLSGPGQGQGACRSSAFRGRWRHRLIAVPSLLSKCGSTNIPRTRPPSGVMTSKNAGNVARPTARRIKQGKKEAHCNAHILGHEGGCDGGKIEDQTKSVVARDAQIVPALRCCSVHGGQLSGF